MLQDPFSFPCYVFEKAIAKLDLHFGRRIVQGQHFGLQMSRLVPLSLKFLQVNNTSARIGYGFSVSLQNLIDQ